MFAVCTILTNLAARSATAAATEPSIEPVRRAAAMLTLLIIVLSVLLLATLLVIVSKRIRRRQAAIAPRSSAPMSDPWVESARRVQPFDSGDAD